MFYVVTTGLHKLHAWKRCHMCTKIVQGIDENIIENYLSPTQAAYRPLCFKKIRTTTTTVFLISNKVVLNPYSHSAAFHHHSFRPLFKFQVCLIDLSQSDIQILYDLQIDNGTQQHVNSGWTGIFWNKFMVHGQYIKFATPLLIWIY